MLDRAQDIKSADDNAGTFARVTEHLDVNKVDYASTPFRFGVPLKINPRTEQIVGNKKASQMLTREYRTPFVVPAAGQV